MGSHPSRLQSQVGGRVPGGMTMSPRCDGIPSILPSILGGRWDPRGDNHESQVGQDGIPLILPSIPGGRQDPRWDNHESQVGQWDSTYPTLNPRWEAGSQPGLPVSPRWERWDPTYIGGILPFPPEIPGGIGGVPPKSRLPFCIGIPLRNKRNFLILENIY